LYLPKHEFSDLGTWGTDNNMGRKLLNILMRAGFSLGLLIAASHAASADNFGAIAYSPSSGARGYSYDYSSRREAEARAMSECSANGRGCKTVIWFKNACGALARGSNGWGSAWAGNRGNAERAAIANCSKHTGGCRVLTWSCTSK